MLNYIDHERSYWNNTAGENNIEVIELTVQPIYCIY